MVQSLVENDEGITRVLSAYPQYRAIWERAEVAEVRPCSFPTFSSSLSICCAPNAVCCTRHLAQGGERLVDDAFFQRNVKVLELAFDGQFHYGMFYAFVKLKEQEVKNLVRVLSGLSRTSGRCVVPVRVECLP